MRAEVLQHVGVSSQLKAIDRGVARDAPGALVVVDDQEFTRLGEKIVQAAGDDHVHIQEQGRASKSVQVLAEGDQLGPAPLGDAGRQIECGDGQALHFAADARAVIGPADKAKVPAQVPAQHGIQPVDVFGAVFRAPLHAEDVADGRHAGRCCKVCRYCRTCIVAHQSAWRFLMDFCLGLARLIWPPEVRRWLPSTRSCLISGRWPPRLLYLSTLTSRGPGMRSSSTVRSLTGWGRHSTSSLPMCWMGAALSSAVSSWYISSRATRSSLKTRTLIRPWAFRAASISFLAAGVSPSPPTRTTGSRWWALARCSRRSAGVS